MTEMPAAAREATTEFGVYIHVPFCRHRCDYCAFATWTDRHHLEAPYLAACAAQIRGEVASLPAVTSVFIGGGTPTLVDPDALMAVIAEIPLAPDAEVTIECNPDDVNQARFQRYVDGGVNRLSLGVQSMDPTVLATLGRTHDPANVRRAATAAHAVGLDFNIDLIYGAAGETMTQWEATLRDALALEPVHVSAYALTVEAGTPLAATPERFPDDDDQADKYLLATEMLGDAGYEWYEISNWAKPSHRCRHNLLYWCGGEYLPVGCAAHGHRAGRRYWNVRTPDRYIAAIQSHESPVAAGEHLDGEAHEIEALQLLVRTAAGVPIGALDDAVVRGPLEGLVTRIAAAPAAWNVGPGARWVLTERGRLLANEVALRLRQPV